MHGNDLEDGLKSIVSTEVVPRKGLAIRFITLMTHIVVILVWSVIGFVLWIPFLTRMILIFTAGIVTAVFKNVDSTRAQRGLEAAMSFYVRGFEIIFASMRGEVRVVPEGPDRSNIAFFRVLFECIFAVSFWVGITMTWLILIHHGWATVGNMIGSIEWSTKKPVKVDTLEGMDWYHDRIFAAVGIEKFDELRVVGIKPSAIQPPPRITINDVLKSVNGVQVFTLKKAKEVMFEHGNAGVLKFDFVFMGRDGVKTATYTAMERK